MVTIVARFGVFSIAALAASIEMSGLAVAIPSGAPQPTSGRPEAAALKQPAIAAGVPGR